MHNSKVGEVASETRRPDLYPPVQFVRSVEFSDLVEYRKPNYNNHTLAIE
jgi:hypothetical protein